MTILDSNIQKINEMVRGYVNEIAMKEADFAD